MLWAEPSDDIDSDEDGGNAGDDIYQVERVLVLVLHDRLKD